MYPGPQLKTRHYHCLVPRTTIPLPLVRNTVTREIFGHNSIQCFGHNFLFIDDYSCCTSLQIRLLWIVASD